MEEEGHCPEDCGSSGDGAENADHSTIKLYYATDRAPITSSAAKRDLVGWLILTLASAGVTMIVSAVAFRLRRGWLMKVVAASCALGTCGLGFATVCAGLQGTLLTEEPGKSGQFGYGSERGPLVWGSCKVSIPNVHRVGELETPSVFRLEFKENPDRHVMLTDVASVDANEFFHECRCCVKHSKSKGAFVFIHGYNVTFEDAARRTAQIAYDLKFDGVPMFYSWPSQGTITGYTVDETNVRWTVPHLKEFLMQMHKRSGAQQVHLIAHSMGNRALTAALRDLSFEPLESRPKFHEVVLTAPDIDADVFRRDIAPAIVKTAQRVTLYASSNDKALAYSKTVHGYPRAGDSGQLLVVTPGVETVDVSAVDTSLLGHSYYGSNRTVLADLFEVLHEAKPADQRTWLRPERLGALRYWIFQR